jgi:predicted KAP-like P-loop ATPase
MILSDNETKVDLLNNEPIAKTIVALLRKHSEHPITIGVHGDWGAGKSSVLEMVEASLEGDDRVLCLKFNGWRFQGFEDAKIALIEGIVTGLLEKRPLLTKASAAVKDVLHRIDLLKLAKRAGGLVTAAAGFYSGHYQLGMMGLVASLEGTLVDPANLTKEKIGEIVDGAKELLKEKDKDSASNVPEEIAEFRKAFDKLLQEAKIDQLIVLVDDLDRCLPETAIETLEAIRLFVFTARTAFVVAADEAMIEYSVRKHFPELPDSTGPQSYARNYLEKLIQVPFRIPTLGQTETRIYVTLLLVGAELGENDPAFSELISVARGLLTRPWVGGVLDAATTKSALGTKEKSAHNALLISDQVGPILASGTRGNPRQIKRFLNTLLLRQASAEARGFGDDVKLPVLAKLMLAERFNSRVFDQIAMASASAPDGVCPDLSALETAAKKRSGEPAPKQASKEEATVRKPAAKSEVPPSDGETSAMLAEWLASPNTLEWARLKPPLAKIDLRPYLFVTKDRKDFFGMGTAFGQIATIVERLLGAKLAVQAEEANLRSLAPPEAAQVFEMLRTRIIASDSFEKAPDGVDGMAVLVRAQPSLQMNLLDFLEALPTDRLGAWVCGGWANALKDPAAVKRFDQLLEGWSKNGSSLLKVTAANTLRMRTQGGR